LGKKRSDVKVALGQFNPILGDCESNGAKILQTIATAKQQKVSLLVFPELAITGYPPLDLLDSEALITANTQWLSRIAAEAQGIAVVVGFVEKNGQEYGKPFFNAAALLRAGKVESVYRKQLLPYYDVFDDERYFEAGSEPCFFELEGITFAITICEDLWNQPGFIARPYAKQPLDAISKKRVDYIVNLSASPFHLSKPELREKLFLEVTRKTGAGLIYCNSVGAQDDLIFDGGSQLWNAQGQACARAPHFAEAFCVGTLGDGPIVNATERSASEWIFDALVLGVSDYCSKTRSPRICLGLSGGIDSSVVAAIAARAVGPNNVKGILLPTQFTSSASNEDAQALANHLGIEAVTLPTQSLFESSRDLVASVLGKTLAGLTQENLQPRLRMLLLMAVANEENRLLLNTSNKSELACGYATLYGDAAGALGVLGDLTKGQVVALGHWLNREHEVIPRRVLERPPSAELRDNQTDQDSLPPYSIVDTFVESAVEKGQSLDAFLTTPLGTEVPRFRALYAGSEFKRRAFPPLLRVSSHAIGRGRRIPVVSRKPW
jgi:NAD+ synthase (glutamine-hydrolysing)